jgi:hypothetical protein
MARTAAPPKNLRLSRKKANVATPLVNNEGEYTWKYVAPTDKNKTKVVNNKTYHWCPQHKALTLHTSRECCLGTKKEAPTYSSCRRRK